MKTTTSLLLLQLWFISSLFAQGTASKMSPDELFGHLIGTDISDHPDFKKEFSYGKVEMGMLDIGADQRLFGILLEPEVGFAFYEGKLCTISYEYRDNDAFNILTDILGYPKFSDTYNDVLGEIYSFVWEGEQVRITQPVFRYGPVGSQFITIEDLVLSEVVAN